MNILTEYSITGRYTNYTIQVTDLDILEAKDEETFRAKLLYWLARIALDYVTFTPPTQPTATPDLYELVSRPNLTSKVLRVSPTILSP